LIAKTIAFKLLAKCEQIEKTENGFFLQKLRSNFCHCGAGGNRVLVRSWLRRKEQNNMATLRVAV